MPNRYRAFLVAVLWLLCGRAGAFVFVHLSDPHVNVTGAGRFRDEGVANLRRVVGAIQIIKPAFVIVTGDVTELGDGMATSSTATRPPLSATTDGYVDGGAPF
jgi:3',5'-cyclic AMP phosphodiesterase CpdA